MGLLGIEGRIWYYLGSVDELSVYLSNSLSGTYNYFHEFLRDYEVWLTLVPRY
jgi:hypothetical protein